MADVSVKMGVSGVAQFIQSMQQAGASVKTIDAALKQNEKQLKKTGDAETYLQQKTQLLQGKLKEQSKACKEAETALKAMENSGVKPASKAYQDMQKNLLNAQTAMMDTEIQIQNLGTQSQATAKQTNELEKSLGGLNKKVSLEQVITAIGGITSAMEKAGKQAVELGKKIWENITDSARWADDAATQAMILNMNVEDYQKYKKVFDTVGELTVAEWQKMKLKVQTAINQTTDEQATIFSLLGIKTHEGMYGKYGWVDGAARDFESVFWEIASKLREKVENKEISQAQADLWAQALFGKGFAELYPLMQLGEEGFVAALEEQNVVTEESVNKLATLNDQLVKLQGDFDTLKAEVLAGLAPALTDAAKAVDSLLGRLIEYAQSPEGQEAISRMGESLSKMFEGLGEINPEDVVEKFTSVVDGVVGSFEWIANNWSSVVDGIKAIGAAFLGLKVAEAGLTFIKFVSGLKGLLGGGGGGTNTGTGGDLSSAGGGTSFLRNLFTVITTKVGEFATALTTYDPTGAAALIPQVLEDQTVAGRTMRDGGSFLDAVKTIPTTIAASFQQAMQNWANWLPSMAEAESNFFDAYMPNAFKQIGPEISEEEQQKQMEELQAGFDEWKATIHTEPEVPEDAKETISEDIGTVPTETAPVVPEDAAEQISSTIGAVPVLVVPQLSQKFGFPGGAGGSTNFLYDRSALPGAQKANGLPFVPFDGYAAILHKGEQVVPAREAASRNFSSNLYVESMYMNNGTDADGLAAAMAAAQRRTLAGFGS